MANVALPKGEIVVDARGRTSLARVRDQEFTRYLVDEHADGTLVLTPAIVVTPAELDRLRAGEPLAGGMLTERTLAELKDPE